MARKLSTANIAYYSHMQPFRESGLLAIDLVNTWVPELADPERLSDTRQLSRFFEEFGIDARASHSALEHCRALRTQVLTILIAPEPEELIARLNAFLAQVSPAVEVEQREGGWALSLKTRARGRANDRITGRVAAELVDLVTRHGPERIRSCEASPCIEVFVDTSRNARRRYCSHRCANRVNAARHRRRLRGKNPR